MIRKKDRFIRIDGCDAVDDDITMHLMQELHREENPTRS